MLGTKRNKNVKNKKRYVRIKSGGIINEFWNYWFWKNCEKIL